MASVDTDHTRAADRHDAAYLALRAAMPAANLTAALRCAARLQSALPHPEQLSRNLVLVAFGGGKDSAYTVAFVRAMQLILYRVHGSTFRMRVATNRHAGMPRAVMENIDRAYRALGLLDDPDCELLLIDGDEVSRFDVDTPQHPAVVRRNRLDILMTGHRTFADGRPTFCNSCNLSVANSFGLAAAYGEGADLIITGDSTQEQRQYTRWIGQLARRLAPPGRPIPRPRRGSSGIGRVLSQLDGVAQAYFADIHGSEASEELAQRRVAADVPQRLQFFSIYSDTHYAADDHLELLVDFLGFTFDEIAFSFTESDCGNPALMAHLRGLKSERLFQRSYADGMTEYVQFALELMRRKDIPPDLIDQMAQRYQGPEAITRMRQAAQDYAWDTFGLGEDELVCMVYSPFTGKGAGLEQYLSREHPALAGRLADLHALLAGEIDEAPLAAELARISGLELSQLRVLYSSPRPGPGTEVIDAVLAGDPHKAVIATRHSPDGPQILEQISGR